MEVNSCLTILPSDVFSRELGREDGPRNAVWGLCCGGRGSNVHSYLIRRRRQQRHPAVFCRDLLLERRLECPGRERFIRLCTTLLIFCCFFFNMLHSHLPPADLAGRKHTGCISRKSNNERLVKEREKKIVFILIAIHHFHVVYSF